jgi:putative membrane protein
MRRAVVLVLAIGAAVLLLDRGTATAAPSDQDQAFLRAAHEMNVAEISAGELAVRRSATDEIRRHARLFVADHKRLDAELRTLAARLSVSLPSGPSRAHQAQAKQLSGRSDDSFDTAWLAQQITMHRQSLQAGRQQIANGSDPQVTALARRAAPVVAAHLAILEETANGRTPDAVEGGAGGESAGDPPRWAPVGLGLIGVAVVLAAGALFAFLRRRRA